MENLALLHSFEFSGNKLSHTPIFIDCPELNFARFRQCPELLIRNEITRCTKLTDLDCIDCPKLE